MTDESHDKITTAELLARIEAGWKALEAYLATLTPDQMTAKTDAAGWTVKDHLIHMAKWEYGMVALVDGGSRLEAMGIGDAAWDVGIDNLNALIQKRNKDLSLDEIFEETRAIHSAVTARISQLADADLLRPYKHYQPDSDRTEPVVGWLIGDTYEHYEEHLPWMKAIAEG